MQTLAKLFVLALVGCHAGAPKSPPPITCNYHTLRAHNGGAELYERHPAPACVPTSGKGT